MQKPKRFLFLDFSVKAQKGGQKHLIPHLFRYIIEFKVKFGSKTTLFALKHRLLNLNTQKFLSIETQVRIKHIQSKNQFIQSQTLLVRQTKISFSKFITILDYALL